MKESGPREKPEAHHGSGTIGWTTSLTYHKNMNKLQLVENRVYWGKIKMNGIVHASWYMLLHVGGILLEWNSILRETCTHSSRSGVKMYLEEVSIKRQMLLIRDSNIYSVFFNWDSTGKSETLMDTRKFMFLWKQFCPSQLWGLTWVVHKNE